MSFYDEIEIEDMTYHPDTNLYTYPCPCGDQFQISLQDLRDGEEIAVCPSCSLQIKVILEAVRSYVLQSSKDTSGGPDEFCIGGFACRGGTHAATTNCRNSLKGRNGRLG